jgi:orotidine-5'-phosphate decarboxylase
VKDFVVPATRPEWIQKLRAHLENCMEPGTFALYAPGFGAQGGEIEVCCGAAGQRFHPIVGRDIYDGFLEAEELMRAEAKRIVGKLQST